jgi:hypothetical protein
LPAFPFSSIADECTNRDVPEVYEFVIFCCGLEPDDHSSFTLRAGLRPRSLRSPLTFDESGGRPLTVSALLMKHGIRQSTHFSKIASDIAAGNYAMQAQRRLPDSSGCPVGCADDEDYFQVSIVEGGI